MIKIWFSNNQLATNTWSLKNCSSRWNWGISLNPCCNPVCWFIWEVAINNYCEIFHMQLNCMEVCVNRTIILEPPKQIITWSELGSNKNSWGSTGVLLVKTPVSCERGALDEILMVCTIIIIIAYEYSLESIELDVKETCTKKNMATQEVCFSSPGSQAAIFSCGSFTSRSTDKVKEGLPVVYNNYCQCSLTSENVNDVFMV